MSLPASRRSSRLRAVVPPMRLLRLTEATRTATDLPGSARSGLHGWGSSSGRGCLGGEGVPQDIQRVRRGVLLSFALSGEHAADQLEPGVEVVVELDDAEAAAAWQATAERPLADRSGHDHAAVDQVGAQQAQAVVDVVDLGGGGDDQRQDAQPLGADPAVGKAAVVEVGEQRQGVAVPLDDVVAGGDVGLACWGGEPAAQQVDLVAVELFPELPGADVDDLEVDLAFAELVADPWPDPAQVAQRELGGAHRQGAAEPAAGVLDVGGPVGEQRFRQGGDGPSGRGQQDVLAAALLDHQQLADQPLEVAVEGVELLLHAGLLPAELLSGAQG